MFFILGNTVPAVVCRGGMAGVSLKPRRLANGPRTRENFLPTQKRLLQRVVCGGKLKVNWVVTIA